MTYINSLVDSMPQLFSLGLIVDGVLMTPPDIDNEVLSRGTGKNVE